MSAWLSERGHDVQVVTAPPYYPEWRIGEGYSGRWFSSGRLAGVRVLRCPLWVPRQPGGLKRLVHLLSFALSSIPALLWSFVAPQAGCDYCGGACDFLRTRGLVVGKAFRCKMLAAYPGF
jgi:hypothetical protein